MNTQDFFANINELAAQIHQNNVEKGFWDEERLMYKVFMLIVSELSEALEAHRKGRRSEAENIESLRSFIATGMSYNNEGFKNCFEEWVKDTLEDELADSVIRILDYAGSKKMNLPNNTNEATIGAMSKFAMSVPAWLFSITKLICEASDRTLYVAQQAPLHFALCRLFQIAENQEIDLPKHVEWKVAYNKHHRPHKHGKKY
jgi:NTP pyrophosphatase (non-canonical NTP hydrolase)